MATHESFGGRAFPGNHREIQERSEEQVHQELREILKDQPRITVGIILDGNRRWAKDRFGIMAPVAHKLGHDKGTEKVIGIVRHFREELPPMNLMPWGFSTDNWSRPANELKALFPLLNDTVELMTREAMEFDGRIIHMGRKEPLYDSIGNLLIRGLPETLKETLARAEELTKNNKGAIIAPAINYLGRDEITRIEQRFQEAKMRGEIPEDARLTEDMQMLFGDDRGELGEMSVIIRTAGEYRLSKFGWRADPAEFRVTDKRLPEVENIDIELLILDGLKAEKRHGK